MKWASAISLNPTLGQAIDEVAELVRGRLEPHRPDLLVAFVSSEFRGAFEHVSERLNALFDGALLLGCSAGGVIGGGHEVERQAGLSLTGAWLPDVRVSPLALDAEDLPRPGSSAEAWEARLGVAAGERPVFVVLPDPFSFDPQPLIGAIDHFFPGSTVVGGMASGGRMPGGNALYLGDSVYETGAVMVALTGNIVADTVVAQGCRPIGQPLFVTSCDGGLLRSLDGQRPHDVLVDLYQRCDERDRRLFRHSLFLGLVMREGEQSYQSGDFLIRNIVGMEPKAGIMQVAARLREGQVVQFHLRDAETSAEDLTDLLEAYADDERETEPTGALLFSCLGRGIYLYGEADHDSRLFRTHVGDLPVGGFFCNGEIGPIQGRTFLHGYTSSFGIFRPKVP